MTTLALVLLPFSLIGLFVCWHIMRPQRPPADTSNRINKIRLLWFALTRENVLAPHIPWLRRDELANIAPERVSEVVKRWAEEHDKQLRIAQLQMRDALQRTNETLKRMNSRP